MADMVDMVDRLLISVTRRRGRSNGGQIADQCVKEGTEQWRHNRGQIGGCRSEWVSSQNFFLTVLMLLFN